MARRLPSFAPMAAIGTVALVVAGCSTSSNGQSGGFDWFNLIWIFFIFSSIYPAFRKSMLNQQRSSLFRRLQDKRGSRVISLIHRQETLSFLGFPVFRYIDIDDSETLLRVIHLTDESKPIDLILHTPGGLVLAAEQIARALLDHKGPVTVFVPHYAMSGGTLIALAADAIVMDPHAVLGPVDPQLGEMPAASILAAVAAKEPKDIDDDTLIKADIARKALAQVSEAVIELVSERMTPEAARELAQTLATGKWTHDYPITVKQARELGLPVSTDMPDEVYALMALFPQAASRRPSVEYVPEPSAPSPRAPVRERRRGSEGRPESQ
jgi:ClpP class serine protease